MKKQLSIIFLLASFLANSQSLVPIASQTQYALSRGGLQCDSSFCVPMKDTVSPFVHYSNMRKVGRVYYRPQDFRGYIYDGLKWRPLNTFTASLEAKLNGISSGATVNQTDAYLLDRSNHTGVQSYTTIVGLSPVSWTGNYIDLMGRPDLSVFMQYSDTLSLSNRINRKINMTDTIGGSGTGAIMTTASANASLNQKVSKSSTITINGNTQNFTTNPSFSGVGIELPSQTGQSGKVLGTNGTTASWVNSTSGSYTSGAGINISGGNVISNTAPDQTVTITGGNRISVTGTYPNFTISYIEPSINIVSSKTLNSNFTVSATKQAFVSYSLTCTVTNPLLAGSSTANVFLEYSTNGGSTWLLPSQNGNSSTVGVAVAIAITNGQTVTVAGSIPANAQVRLRTSTTGTASVVYVTGMEIY